MRREGQAGRARQILLADVRRHHRLVVHGPEYVCVLLLRTHIVAARLDALNGVILAARRPSPLLALFARIAVHHVRFVALVRLVRLVDPRFPDVVQLVLVTEHQPAHHRGHAALAAIGLRLVRSHYHVPGSGAYVPHLLLRHHFRGSILAGGDSLAPFIRAIELPMVAAVPGGLHLVQRVTSGACWIILLLRLILLYGVAGGSRGRRVVVLLFQSLLIRLPTLLYAGIVGERVHSLRLAVDVMVPPQIANRFVHVQRFIEVFTAHWAADIRAMLFLVGAVVILGRRAAVGLLRRVTVFESGGRAGLGTVQLADVVVHVSLPLLRLVAAVLAAVVYQRARVMRRCLLPVVAAGAAGLFLLVARGCGSGVQLR